MTTTNNKLYFGDNLDILRQYVADESVDLIYLDPPFNSNATYNVLFQEKSGQQSAAQITAFDDTWHWGMESEYAYHAVVTDGPQALANLLQAMRAFLGQNDMMAYLTMMAQRMCELHRVLKPTGSIYLHCDPSASHYLKLLLDAVFGSTNFKNEIVWCYKSGGASPKRHFSRKHDTIFFYTCSNSYNFNRQQEKSYNRDRKPYRFQGVAEFEDEEGWYTLVGMKDYWNIDMVGRTSAERLGYPTQKPEALLERIITASSNEGDVVLDPFCGCGPTIAVAERLKRSWIGIDVTHLAITLIRHRLHDSFGQDLRPYQLIGDPKDLPSAHSLAQHDRYQFEWWALGLVDARPAQDKRKGADAGIDGYINFFDDNSGQAKRVIVQVKSGNVSVSQIRDLKGVLAREKAAIGLFITLKPPTGPMRKEAAAAGFYQPSHFLDHTFPHLQILTIEELLCGTQAQYPRFAPQATFRQAPRRLREQSIQAQMI